MARTYVKAKRAEQEQETRRRIAQAAIDLHREHGPARTTFSMVAERAGVQRHTLYAHFPDEWTLGLACSGLHFEQHPPPDWAPWAAIGNRRKRLAIAFEAIYRWFEESADLLNCVLRDAEYHDVSRRIMELRMGPTLAKWFEVLGAADDPPAARAMLGLALSFHSWRSLSRSGLTAPEAAAQMAAAVMVAA